MSQSEPSSWEAVIKESGYQPSARAQNQLEVLDFLQIEIVNQAAKSCDGGILDAESLAEHLKRAQVPVMAELDVVHVEP
jgi:hypothetical protein